MPWRSTERPGRNEGENSRDYVDRLMANTRSAEQARGTHATPAGNEPEHSDGDDCPYGGKPCGQCGTRH